MTNLYKQNSTILKYFDFWMTVGVFIFQVTLSKLTSIQQSWNCSEMKAALQSQWVAMKYGLQYKLEWIQQKSFSMEMEKCSGRLNWQLDKGVSSILIQHLTYNICKKSLNALVSKPRSFLGWIQILIQWVHSTAIFTATVVFDNKPPQLIFFTQIYF